jgi:hypothetical protein
MDKRRMRIMFEAETAFAERKKNKKKRKGKVVRKRK